MTAKAEDGRVARGLRTREAVIDALFELHAEGTGIAVMQDHPPGPIDSGTAVTVVFEPPR